MLFSKIKECTDDRVIEAGLSVVADFRESKVDVMAFGCCFVKDTLAYSFAYETECPQDLQTIMASQFAQRLPQEEKYRKTTYYTADKFEAECCKKCSGLWLKIQ